MKKIWPHGYVVRREKYFNSCQIILDVITVDDITLDIIPAQNSKRASVFKGLLLCAT